MKQQIKKAFIVGRFQPFHNQHMEYLLKAFEKCDHLFICITRALNEQNSISIHSSHRSGASANVLTYYERVDIISSCLIDEGISKDMFSCTPFPLDTPERMHYFMPKNIKCYTTICDKWNFQKIEILREYGYEIESLIDRRDSENTYISGLNIRNLIVQENPSWKEMVPKTVVKYLEKINYRNRI